MREITTTDEQAAQDYALQHAPILYIEDGFRALRVAYLAGCARKSRAQDEVTKGLVEALRDIIECPHWFDEATVPRAGIEVAPQQVVVNMSVGLLRIRKAKAAIALYERERGEKGE